MLQVTGCFVVDWFAIYNISIIFYNISIPNAGAYHQVVLFSQKTEPWGLPEQGENLWKSLKIKHGKHGIVS